MLESWALSLAYHLMHASENLHRRLMQQTLCYIRAIQVLCGEQSMGFVPKLYAFAAASYAAGLGDRSAFAVAAKYAPSAIMGKE